MLFDFTEVVLCGTVNSGADAHQDTFMAQVYKLSGSKAIGLHVVEKDT